MKTVLFILDKENLKDLSNILSELKEHGEFEGKITQKVFGLDFGDEGFTNGKLEKIISTIEPDLIFSLGRISCQRFLRTEHIDKYLNFSLLEAKTFEMGFHYRVVFSHAIEYYINKRNTKYFKENIISFYKSLISND